VGLDGLRDAGLIEVDGAAVVVGEVKITDEPVPPPLVVVPLVGAVLLAGSFAVAQAELERPDVPRELNACTV
jgi:hypothetical protein